MARGVGESEGVGVGKGIGTRSDQLWGVGDFFRGFFRAQLDCHFHFLFLFLFPRSSVRVGDGGLCILAGGTIRDGQLWVGGVGGREERGVGPRACMPCFKQRADSGPGLSIDGFILSLCSLSLLLSLLPSVCTSLRSHAHVCTQAQTHTHTLSLSPARRAQLHACTRAQQRSNARHARDSASASACAAPGSSEPASVSVREPLPLRKWCAERMDFKPCGGRHNTQPGRGGEVKGPEERRELRVTRVMSR